MKVREKKIAIVLSVLLTIWGLWQLKNVAINSSYYTNRAIAYQNMLKYVVENEPDEVVVILELRKFHEFTYSTAVYLSNMKLDVPVSFAYIEKEDSNPRTDYDKYKASFKKNTVNVTDLFELLEMDDIGRSDKKVAVIFADPDKGPPSSLSSFSEGFKEMRSFSQPYFNLAIGPLLKGDFDAAFNSNNRIRYLLLMN